VNSLVAGRFVDPTWSMITTSERPLITQIIPQATLVVDYSNIFIKSHLRSVRQWLIDRCSAKTFLRATA